jgi:predicted  nucleic acid-binding Zn-ribbon protein
MEYSENHLKSKMATLVKSQQRITEKIERILKRINSQQHQLSSAEKQFHAELFQAKEKVETYKAKMTEARFYFQSLIKIIIFYFSWNFK